MKSLVLAVVGAAASCSLAAKCAAVRDARVVHAVLGPVTATTRAGAMVATMAVSAGFDLVREMVQ